MKLKTKQRNAEIRYPLWTRQDFEADEAWIAFETYRGLPWTGRDCEAVHTARPDLPWEKLGRWEKAHFWKERAAEYDRYLDVATVGEVVLDRTIATVRRAALDTVADFHALLNGEVKVYLAKQRDLAKQGGNIELFKPHEMIRALREVVLLGRLLMGESTENVAMNFDLSKLTDVELAMLTDIQRRQLAPAGVPTPVETTGEEIDDVPEDKP